MPIVKRLLFVVLAATFTAAFIDAQTAKPKNPLAGFWVCADDGTKLEIRENGSLTINGEEHVYKVRGSVITVTSEEGSMAIPFELDRDTLTVDVEGREMVYERIKGNNTAKSTGKVGGGGVMQQLVGKWCYISSTGNNARMSNRCFVLNGNGTYEYSSETSSSGAYGGSASQEYDSGRWSATASTLTANSNKNGQIVYPMELRNHPKTGDPMIVVDGDAYVTAYQKRPW